VTNKWLFLWSCHHILWTPLRQVVILWYLITSWFSLCLYLGKLILVFPEYPLHFHIFSQGTWWNGREISYPLLIYSFYISSSKAFITMTSPMAQHSTWYSQPSNTILGSFSNEKFQIKGHGCQCTSRMNPTCGAWNRYISTDFKM